MQIFFVDESPLAAAMALCDAHVVKMPVEAMQLIATYCHTTGQPVPLKADGTPYKPIAQGKELVAWLCESPQNVKWLAAHAVQCCIEYTTRYGGRQHATAEEAVRFWSHRTTRVEGVPSPFPRRWSAEADVATLDAISETVEAYREYYRGKVKAKPGSFRWANGRSAPGWVLV